MSKQDPRPQRPRPDQDEYYMEIAKSVRSRANCKGNRIGAIMVVGNRIVATGYNGVPDRMEECEDGGCYRCSNRDRFPSGTAYDVCICVHAEQNALLTAARHGISVSGGTLYTTMRPCFGCTKELIQAQVEHVYFIWDWPREVPELDQEYRRLQARIRVDKMDLEDADADWALSPPSEPVEETGHNIP